MTRPSTIARLPGDIREAIGRLRDQGRTLDEILNHLQGMEVSVSRSALGRHVQQMDKVGERLRRSRAISEALVRQLGDAPESRTATLNIEMMHSFLFDFLASAEEGGTDEASEAALAHVRDPKSVALMAEAVQRLTTASRHNVEFVARVEDRAAQKAKAGAARAAETAARAQGLSADTIATIKASILGVAA